jgi:hypothetical protein
LNCKVTDVFLLTPWEVSLPYREKRMKEMCLEIYELSGKVIYLFSLSFSVWNIQPANNGILLLLQTLHQYMPVYMLPVFRKEIPAVRLKRPLNSVEHKESVLT